MRDIKAKAVKQFYYLPPFGLVTHFLNVSNPARLIKRICEQKDVPAPLSPNTLNKAVGMRPEASSKSSKKLRSWVEEIFPEQCQEVENSVHIKEEGFFGYGCLSWIGILPSLKDVYGDLIPYSLKVIDQLIAEEKTVITLAKRHKLPPLEQMQLIYSNPNVELLLRDIEMPNPPRVINGNEIAGSERAARMVCISALLYLLAACDAEYSALISDHNASKGLFCELLSELPEKPDRKSHLHKIYWSKLKARMARDAGVNETWKLIESHLGDDSDDARRTLNRYKKAEVIISDEKLEVFLISVFGDQVAQYFGPYYFRLKAVIFVGNIFDFMQQVHHEAEGDIPLLVAKYQQFYQCHRKALEV